MAADATHTDSQRAPLAGRSVVVTRAREQAAGFIGELEELGATVVAFPVIEIIDPPDFSAIDEAVARLADYDWIVLSSTNGVERFFARLAATGDPLELLAGARIAVVGTATARALAERGVEPALLPGEFDAEGLVEALLDRGVGAGARVLVPRALVGRNVLARDLGARGVTVDYAPVYQTVPAQADPDTLERLRAGVDAVTFTSPSTVKHFIAFLDAAGIDGAALLESAVVGSIGPVTSEALRTRGIRVDVEPAEFTTHALAVALAAHFTGA